MTRSGHRAGARGRAGRVRFWVPFLIVALALLALFGELEGALAEAGYARVDTRRSRFLEPDPARGEAFVDTRWEAELAARLAALGGAPTTLDPAGLARIAAVVAALPFVAEVGTPRVLWPDGLELPVRTRVPVACVRRGDAYVLVSTDGVLLPGAWPAPPWIGHGYLPVIGPNDASFDDLAAGDALPAAHHWDALAVARSMRAALSAADFEALGPPLVDATRAHQASVEEPGIVVLLEDRRVVWFGRAPDCGAPGELPAELKWASLKRALALVAGDAPRRDWAILDARWDIPAIRWRSSPPDEG